MVTRRTLIAAAASAAGAALLLGACSGSSGGAPDAGDATAVDTEREITLDFAWWGDAARGELYTQALEVFSEQHPNITVRQQFQSWSDYWTARNTEAAAGSLPDVLALDAGHAVMYGDRGQLLDLNSQVGTNLDVSGVQEQLLAAAASGGAQYAVPIGTNSLSLLYNGALLEQLGVEPPAEGYTWDDYDQFLLDLSTAGADLETAVYGGADYTASLQAFSLWLLQQGVAPYVDGAVAFTPEQLTEWLERGDPLRADGAFMPPEDAAQLQVPAFNIGLEASTINWASALGPAINDLGSDDVGLVLPPSGPDGPTMYFTISQAFGASSSTAEPEAAAALIDFLTNAPEVGEIFGTTRGIPATQSQRDGVVVEEGSVDARVLEYAAAVEEVATGTAPAEVPEFTSLEAEWLRLSEELRYGNITVPEFVDGFFDYVDTL